MAGRIVLHKLSKLTWQPWLWPLHWRALLAGALCYLLLPLMPLPAWQLPWQQEDPASTDKMANNIRQFHQQYGEAGWPALRAQLALNRLAAYQAMLSAEQSTFASQRRDSRWAEATEFVIDHVSQDVSQHQLQLLAVECRNNLCQLSLAAPEGLTTAFQQKVLQLAGTLKTAGLEYHQLQQQRQRLILELKSDKPLQFSWWQQWRLQPAAKAHWQADIKHWLHAVAEQPPEPAPEDANIKGAQP